MTMQRVLADPPHALRDLLDEDRIVDPAWASLPPAERVADRLADLLFGADEILGFLSDERAVPLRWLEPEIRKLFNDVDSLIRKIAD
jgi:hypothetical protein